jgi:hypothetical protein
VSTGVSAVGRARKAPENPVACTQKVASLVHGGRLGLRMKVNRGGGGGGGGDTGPLFTPEVPVEDRCPCPQVNGKRGLIARRSRSKECAARIRRAPATAVQRDFRVSTSTGPLVPTRDREPAAHRHGDRARTSPARTLPDGVAVGPVGGQRWVQTARSTRPRTRSGAALAFRRIELKASPARGA